MRRLNLLMNYSYTCDNVVRYQSGNLCLQNTTQGYTYTVYNDKFVTSEEHVFVSETIQNTWLLESNISNLLLEYDCSQ